MVSALSNDIMTLYGIEKKQPKVPLQRISNFGSYTVERYLISTVELQVLSLGCTVCLCLIRQANPRIHRQPYRRGISAMFYRGMFRLFIGRLSFVGFSPTFN